MRGMELCVWRYYLSHTERHPFKNAWIKCCFVEHVRWVYVQCVQCVFIHLHLTNFF